MDKGNLTEETHCIMAKTERKRADACQKIWYWDMITGQVLKMTRAIGW
jgi:hypothetical protein